MKTTVDIPDDELRDVMRYTHAATKREAIVTAIAEFNRRRRMATLIEHAAQGDAAALTAGEACWCPLVRLELWNGAAGDRDRKNLVDFESVLPELTIDNDVWTSAYDLARRARAAGISVPATDILIAACALRHGTELETADSDFERLAPAGVELLVLRDA